MKYHDLSEEKRAELRFQVVRAANANGIWLRQPVEDIVAIHLELKVLEEFLPGKNSGQ